MTLSKLALRAALIAVLIAAGTLLYEGRKYHASTVTTSPARTGREMVMVFLGSTACAPSKQPGFNQVVRRIAEQLRAKAYERGRRLNRIGVALSGSPEEGSEFLADFGPFEE